MRLLICKESGEVEDEIDWDEEGNGEDFMTQAYEIMMSLKSLKQE